MNRLGSNKAAPRVFTLCAAVLAATTVTATSGCGGEKQQTSSTSRGVTASPLDFVFSSLTVDPDDSTPAAGFNLDGAYTLSGGLTGCGLVDRLSDLDLDQNQSGTGGVDNVLPRIATVVDQALQGFTVGGNSNARSRLSDLVSGGQLLLLLRLTGVDDLVEDSAVTASLYFGFSADSECAAMFTGDGQFLVSNSSLATPGDLTTAIWQAEGSIAGGRLAVKYGSSSGLAPDAPSGWPINQLQFRVNLSQSGQAGSAGNLGGWMTGRDLISYLIMLYPPLPATLNDLVPDICDLPGLTSGDCGGDFGAPNGEAGLGMRFSMVRANLVGTASAAGQGSCGAP